MKCQSTGWKDVLDPHLAKTTTKRTLCLVSNVLKTERDTITNHNETIECIVTEAGRQSDLALIAFESSQVQPTENGLCC